MHGGYESEGLRSVRILAPRGLGQDALRSWSALVQQGSDLEIGRSYAEALQTYLSAAKIDDQYAELEFRIARCLWMLGDYRAAGNIFFAPAISTRFAFALTARSTTSIARLRLRRPGAELVDADEIFAKEARTELSAATSCMKHVHMTPKATTFLRGPCSCRSRAIAEGDGASPSQDELPIRLLKPNASNCWPSPVMIASGLRGRCWIDCKSPPFTTQLNHADQVLRLTIKASAPDENPDETASEYQWAIRTKPDDRILHYNFGLFLFDYNRAAAAEQLRMARPWDGFRFLLLDGTPID